jgi:hypothetical protein
MSIGILNKSQTAYRVTLDFSKAKHLLFSTKSAKIEKVNFVII